VSALQGKNREKPAPEEPRSESKQPKGGWKGKRLGGRFYGKSSHGRGPPTALPNNVSVTGKGLPEVRQPPSVFTQVEEKDCINKNQSRAATKNLERTNTSRGTQPNGIKGEKKRGLKPQPLDTSTIHKRKLRLCKTRPKEKKWGPRRNVKIGHSNREQEGSLPLGGGPDGEPAGETIFKSRSWRKNQKYRARWRKRR